MILYSFSSKYTTPYLSVSLETDIDVDVSSKIIPPLFDDNPTKAFPVWVFLYFGNINEFNSKFVAFHNSNFITLIIAHFLQGISR